MYIDNFRCMVNCTIKLQGLSLLLGENGTGKTSLFDALRVLQSFVSGDGTSWTAFRRKTYAAGKMIVWRSDLSWKDRCRGPL